MIPESTIIKLLKSPVLEDTILGIEYLIKGHTEKEIIEFFDKQGDTRGFGSPGYLSRKAFDRGAIKSWVYVYKKRKGFYIGQKCLLIRNTKKRLEESIKIYDVREL